MENQPYVYPAGELGRKKRPHLPAVSILPTFFRPYVLPKRELVLVNRPQVHAAGELVMENHPYPIFRRGFGALHHWRTPAVASIAEPYDKHRPIFRNQLNVLTDCGRRIVVALPTARLADVDKLTELAA
jgi:hypothetical protein